MEFHLTKRALEKYEVDLSLFTYNGGLIFADLRSVREFVYKINQHTDLVNHPEKNIKSSQLNGMALMDEIFHYIFSLYQREILPQAMTKLLTSLQSEFGSNQIDQLLTLYVLQYPPLEILQNRLTVSEYLRNSTHGVPHREKTLENLVLLWVSTQNPIDRHPARGPEVHGEGHGGHGAGHQSTGANGNATRWRQRHIQQRSRGGHCGALLKGLQHWSHGALGEARGFQVGARQAHGCVETEPGRGKPKALGEKCGRLLVQQGEPIGANGDELLEPGRGI